MNNAEIKVFDLIPYESLQELSRLYGVNARNGKYSEDNWRKGYKWHLSFAAMMRHGWSWWGGEDIDKETNIHHLICAAWHCFTLFWFTKHKKEMDDRWGK